LWHCKGVRVLNQGRRRESSYLWPIGHATALCRSGVGHSAPTTLHCVLAGFAVEAGPGRSTIHWLNRSIRRTYFMTPALPRNSFHCASYPCHLLRIMTATQWSAATRPVRSCPSAPRCARVAPSDNLSRVVHFRTQIDPVRPVISAHSYSCMIIWNVG